MGFEVDISQLCSLLGDPGFVLLGGSGFLLFFISAVDALVSTSSGIRPDRSA